MFHKLVLLLFTITTAYCFDSIETNNLMRNIPFGNTCDTQAKNKIATCADELTNLGIFSSGSRKTTLSDMKNHTQLHFMHMCAAYRRYNICLGGSYIKQACYPNEPMKSRYSVVDVVLEYVCGEGYQSMLNNWNCYLSVADSSEIAICEASFIQLAKNTEQMYNDYSSGAGACFALQSYIDCIRPAIEQTCGLQSFMTVIQAVERPVQVYLPFCTLSSSSSFNMAAQGDDDFYGGFDDYDQAYDIQAISQNQQFQQAVARSSHGRRPTTSQMGWRDPMSSHGKPPPTTSGRSRAGGRTAAAMRNEPARPMTAVRAAGYTSFANKVQASEKTAGGDSTGEGEEKCRQMEQKVMEILRESMSCNQKGNLKEALDKAKEAGRREREVVKYREQNSLVETMNLDLTFTVLVNLARQYEDNDMGTEAINSYEIIVKNRMFPNSGRLRANMGNICFKKRDYTKALKYYRMAFDNVPSIQKNARIRILNNIGVTLFRMGNYDDALATFEHCVEEHAEFDTALNLVIVSFCIQDADKMRESYLKLIDIPLQFDDDYNKEDDDVLLTHTLNADMLQTIERKKRSDAEKAILMATKLISPVIYPNHTSGYEWCIESLKQSVHAALATELEMTKAGELMKKGDIDGAVEVLKVFNAQDPKTASAASNNLCMLRLLQGGRRLVDAQQYVEQALSIDRYNPLALVNQGNIAYMNGDLDKASICYREALSNDASCVQAIFNLGLTAKAQGNLELALEYFYKLHNILLNNVQVICQLASIYESLEDTAQAIELYSQANSLVPTDPSILTKLANLYDAEGDKTQAFQCHYDSYRYYPSNMKVIEWMGAYYIENQFSEKAVNYFEKASIMQPHEIKWQLMMASSHRRAGNYQKALELYRSIHKKFPQNIECLKFLVRITSDLAMPEAKEYAEKLTKAEKVRQLKIQRESDSSQGKRHSANSTTSQQMGAIGSSSGASRQFSGQLALLPEGSAPFTVTQRDMKSEDYSYSDPMGPSVPRPKTSGNRRNQAVDDFDALDDTFLPE
ncbi:unnamed protein product [Caenorhabditis bovis]|uniref:Tetratricopeptide repeat protein n=1 Tax=Caenorhabditis bovis TaxID=2654633 RepID=A0A8S1EI75_9PELO|nr:unnamed protein product [Caenorhabditis bovis]